MGGSANRVVRSERPDPAFKLRFGLGVHLRPDPVQGVDDLAPDIADDVLLGFWVTNARCCCQHRPLGLVNPIRHVAESLGPDEIKRLRRGAQKGNISGAGQSESLICFVDLPSLLCVVTGSESLDLFECCKKFHKVAVAFEEPLVHPLIGIGTLSGNQRPHSHEDRSDGAEGCEPLEKVGVGVVHDLKNRPWAWAVGLDTLGTWNVAQFNTVVIGALRAIQLRALATAEIRVEHHKLPRALN